MVSGAITFARVPKRAALAALLLALSLVAVALAKSRATSTADAAVMTRPAAVTRAAEPSSTAWRLGDSAAPQLGPRDAPLTLVEFADFQSDDCGRAAPMAELAHTLYPDRVRVVFRQLPASKHPDARLAAEASLAAHAQGKFWEYHDVLFANPHDLSRTALERYAAAIELDLPAFRHALDTRQFAADVDADIALARWAGAVQLPTMFANGQRVAVPYGIVELRELIDTKSR